MVSVNSSTRGTTEKRETDVRTDLLGWVRLQWDRVGAWGCLLVGVVTLIVGWVGVSNTVFTAKQLPYIAGCGLGGLFLLGTGAMLWLSADLRDEWRVLDRLEKAILATGTPDADRETAEFAADAMTLEAHDVTPRGTAVTAGRSS